MKKLLSTLLALVMVLGTMAMLVPTVMAAVSEPTVLFENDFEDESLASLEGEALIQAIFGENTRRDPRYIMGENLEATVADGKLNLNVVAGGSNFIAKLATDEAISEQGFVVECEYVFHQRTMSGDPATECDARWFGFNCKSVLEALDSNCLLTYVYNGNKSRTAFRMPSSGTWTALVYGEDVALSGNQETKYKLKSVFLPEEGPTLSVAAWDANANEGAGGYGEYVVLGKFDDAGKTLYTEHRAQEEGVKLFGNNVIMNVQHGNNVSIDNLKVTLVEKETYDLTINGEAVSIESAGQLDLTPYYEGTFRFAVVDGVVVKSNFIEVTENTSVIDIYTADVDTLDGAALTTGETTAIRWMASIGKADYDKLVALKTAGGIKNIEYGALYIDASTLGRAEAAAGPKMETEGVKKAAGSAVYEPGYEGLYVFNMDSEAIAAESYNVKLAGRAYMVITFNDDTTMLIEGDYDSGFHARSAAEIALAATLDFENALTDDQLTKVEAIAEAYGK